MLAIDRRIFHIPLEERLRSRTSDLKAWNKTMLPIIRLSISEARNQIITGHQDIHTFLPIKAAPVRNLNATLATATATIDTTNPHRIVPGRTNPRQRQRPKQKSNLPTTTPTTTRRSSYQDIRHFTSGAKSTVATSQAMQTATEASSVASKGSRVVPVRLVQPLVQKCIIQSPQSGNFVFDWLGLGMASAVAFNSLPERVSFLAGSLDSTPIPSPPPSPPISPPLPPPPPITIIDNLSSRYRAHRNRLQPSRTHATQAAATN
jgi:hypothetical protein